jgi:hypothetical protein
MFIRDIHADEPSGSTLSEARAYSGSRLARMGWNTIADDLAID